MKTFLPKTLCTAAAAFALYGGQAHADFIVVGSAEDNRITTDTRWTRDNVYILGRVIFVSNGAKLTIEPGTVVRGLPSTISGIAEEPGSLVVSRGSKVIANGTVDAPIIFTTIDDPNVPGGENTIPDSFTNVLGTTIQVKGAARHEALLANDYTPGGPEGDNGFSKSGDWGGIILSGRGHVSANTGSIDENSDGIWDLHASSITESPTRQQNAGVGTDFPEGLASGSGSQVLNAELSIYGGTDDTDSSGVLSYVVNRYGGFVLGAAAVGNEINGLTMCGIGSGTVLEHIEVYQNKDDGFEWFGGKADTRFLFSHANQDDSFDGDEGFRGNHQFWTAVQGTINGSGAAPLRAGFEFNEAIGQVETASDYQYDKLMEWDGGEPNDGDRLPLTDFKVYNFTFLAGGTKKEGIQIRLEARAGIHNGVIENANTLSRGNDSGGGAYTTMFTWSNVFTYNTVTSGGSLVVQNTATGSQTSTVGGVTFPVITQVNELQANATSQIVTPWTFSATATTPVPCPLYTKHGLDTRLAPGAAARASTFAVALPTGFVNTGFAGSMRDNNQMFGWTSLHNLEVLPTTNLVRPVLTLGESAGNRTISFPSAGADVKYVIEKSTDGRVWTVLTVNPLSGAGTISHTDTTTTVSDRVLYRAYGL